MEWRQMKSEVKKRLPEKRYEHVLRVVDMAERLADRHGISVKRAKKAALLHDVAKFMDREELRRIVIDYGEDESVLDFHHELWHAPAGAVIAREQFGIDDERSLDAIRYHTTGRAGMTSLEKVIYIADLVEEGRTFPGADTLRQYAQTATLEKGMLESVRHTVRFLLEKRAQVHPDSLACYNEHVQLVRETKE